MNTETILVSRQCNQACGFCERVRPDQVPPSLAELRAALARAIERGARTIVFAGGEPLLRPDLLLLVRQARVLGATDVVLETNGTRLTPAVARSLRTMGLTSARVLLVTADAERHRLLVGEETRPTQVLQGIAAALDAGLSVSVRLPIARGLPSAASRIAGLQQSFPAIKLFELAPTLPGAATLRPEQALDLTRLGSELSEAYRTGSRLKVAVELAQDMPVPPCVVDVKGGARRLLATQLRSEEGELNTAAPECASCALSSRCRISAEQLAKAASTAPIHPIAEAAEYLHPGRNPGSRLRVLGATEVEKFFHVDYEFGVDDVHRGTSRIGIIYRCNQVCTFCELADMDTRLEPDKVRRAIDSAAARGSKRLILTGGEPTLSPDLPDYVRHARERGFEMIEVQTNAVLLDKPGLAEELREAGLTHAQVSLHGPDSAISDALTAAPGTHRRTLAGVENLLRNGVGVLLNHLVFKDNCHLLVDFVDMVHARWGVYRGQLVIQFHSARNEFPDRAEGLRHIARYSDYVHTLRAAIDRARSLGYAIHDLQDPTGIPSLCILGGDENYLGPIIRQAELPRIHEWERDWLTRVAACERCEVREACIGVPKHYLALHGDGEFAPLRRDGKLLGTAREHAAPERGRAAGSV